MYRLEHWFIEGKVAYGNVYGNPAFRDGTFIRTSEIQEATSDTIRTRNSTYLLGNSYINNLTVRNNHLDKLVGDVIEWARERGILEHSDPKTQALKTVSEVGEYADNVAKGRDCKDDIGDIIVTLILQAHLQGTTIEECLQLAYNEISKRKGKMVNGVFVKEGDGV